MKTKVIATIGKNSDSEEMMKAMVENGMDIARITFSHCTYDEYKFRAEYLKEVSQELGRKVEIMQDLQGPKIRLGNIPGSPMEIKSGEAYNLPANLNLNNLVKPGDLVLVHEGRVQFEMQEILDGAIKVKALSDGIISSRNGINFPNVKSPGSSVTEKDLSDLKFALETYKPDYVAISFVTSADDIQKLREIINDRNVKIVAKIENAYGLENIDKIAQAADLVMVARGDLGVEISKEKLPLAQKLLIETARKYSKPCIVATGLLSSMNTDSFPSSADIADVTLALEQGADMLLLSNETTSGKYPLEALKTLINLVQSIETLVRPLGIEPRTLEV